MRCILLVFCFSFSAYVALEDKDHTRHDRRVGAPAGGGVHGGEELGVEDLGIFSVGNHHAWAVDLCPADNLLLVSEVPLVHDKRVEHCSDDLLVEDLCPLGAARRVHELGAHLLADAHHLGDLHDDGARVLVEPMRRLHVIARLDTERPARGAHDVLEDDLYGGVLALHELGEGVVGVVVDGGEHDELRALKLRNRHDALPLFDGAGLVGVDAGGFCPLAARLLALE